MYNHVTMTVINPGYNLLEKIACIYKKCQGYEDMNSTDTSMHIWSTMVRKRIRGTNVFISRIRGYK